nr:phospholipid scramblase 3-like [Drosophila takahashii]
MDCLSSLDSVLVNQQVDFQEVVIGFSRNRRYFVRAALKTDPILTAVQDNKFVDRVTKPNYMFTLRVMNPSSTQVMHIDRIKPDAYFKQPRVEVLAPPGNLIGVIKLHSFACPRTLHVMNTKDQLEYVINNSNDCCGGFEAKFVVTDVHKKEIALIEKLFGGVIKEIYTDSDNYKVNFKGLDTRTKALLLASVFFIDGLFFETTAVRKFLI